MLEFDTENLKKETALISSTDAVFKDTDLENTGFKIMVREPMREDVTNFIHANVNDKGDVNQGSFQKALFLNGIVAVEGIVDKNQNPITLEDGVREILFEYSSQILKDEIFSKIQSLTESSNKKKETQTQGLEPMHDGQ